MRLKASEHRLRDGEEDEEDVLEAPIEKKEEPVTEEVKTEEPKEETKAEEIPTVTMPEEINVEVAEEAQEEKPKVAKEEVEENKE